MAGVQLRSDRRWIVGGEKIKGTYFPSEEKEDEIERKIWCGGL